MKDVQPTYRQPRGVIASALSTVLALMLLLTACAGGAVEADDEWLVSGSLLAYDGEIWIVDAIPIVVPANVVPVPPSIGAIITARGAHDESGRRVARSVKIVDGGMPVSTLSEATVTGPIADIDESIWIVNDISVLVPEGTALSADGVADPWSLVAIGTVVEIHGYRTTGHQLIATEVRLFPFQEVVAAPSAATPSEAAITTPTIAPSPTSAPTSQSTASPSSPLELAAPPPAQVAAPTAPADEGEDDKGDGNGSEGKEDEPDQDHGGERRDQEGDHDKNKGKDDDGGDNDDGEDDQSTVDEQPDRGREGEPGKAERKGPGGGQSQGSNGSNKGKGEGKKAGR